MMLDERQRQTGCLPLLMAAVLIVVGGLLC